MDGINCDRPIDSLKSDRIGRHDFIKGLVSLLKNRTASDSLVVGLYGEWGSGKTSIINIVCNLLREANEKNSDFHIVRFNPWLYSDKSDLIQAFFVQLIATLKIEQSRYNKLIELLTRYSRSINTAIDVLKIYDNIAGGLASLLYSITSDIVNQGDKKKEINNLDLTHEKISEYGLSEIKQQIIDEIKKNKKHIIVFIDDLDRLDDIEVYNILKLVKAIVDFPYMTYILCFDYDKVIESLNSIGNMDKNLAKKYLEKIIQLPVTIPKIRDVELKRYLIDKIESILGKEKICKSEKTRGTFYSNILPYFKNFRDINIFCNTLSLRHNILSDYVNNIDLIGITVIQVFEKDIYDRIYASRKKLCSADESEKMIGEIIGENGGECLRNILEPLFLKQDSRSSCNYRINSYLYFDRYFMKDVSNKQIISLEVKNLFSFKSENDISATIQDFLSSDYTDNFFDEIRKYVREEKVDIENKEVFINVLIDDWNKFIKIENSIFDIRKDIITCITNIINTIDYNNQKKVIDKIFIKENTPLEILMDLVCKEEYRYLYLRTKEEILKNEITGSNELSMLFLKIYKKRIDKIYGEEKSRLISIIDSNDYLSGLIKE